MLAASSSISSSAGSSGRPVAALHHPQDGVHQRLEDRGEQLLVRCRGHQVQGAVEVEQRVEVDGALGAGHRAQGGPDAGVAERGAG
jgi:hypothetical protein